jgi:transcriptional regulator with XRE-family HTH domain
MKRLNVSEKVLVEEVAGTALQAKLALKGLTIGALIKMIRNQLGMSQKILAKRAPIPQSAISRLEKGKRTPSLSTLNKVLSALFCDLLIVPALSESIDAIRKNQARKKAEKHIRYLKGTMSLEKQQPDDKILHLLLKEEEDRLLKSSGSELWEE